MKKYLVFSIIICVLVLAGLSLFVFVNNKKERENTTAKNPIDNRYVADMLEAQTTYKTSCPVLEYESDGIYRNERFGFQFSVPPDMLVCEDLGDYELSSITLWDKEGFYSSREHPDDLIANIYIEIPGVPSLFDQLSQPIIVKQEEVTIDGITGMRTEVRSPSCADIECPGYRKYEFVTNGYSLTIQEQGEKDDIVDSLRFDHPDTMMQ